MMNTEKVLALAAKLLAVQESRGASENEAAVAAEHLQKLLQDHNLTLSQVEADQGASDVKRVKDAVTGSVWQPWRAKLISGIAKNNFCLAADSITYVGKNRVQRILVIGREVNVNVTKMTYDYLADAFLQIVKAKYGVRTVATRRDHAYFMDGAVSRVVERLDLRRREREAEDAARAANATGNGTHRELVLSDVYGSEAELNNDALNGYPPGTTAQRNREAEERRFRQRTEHDRLVAEGIDSTVAWYRAYGYSEEQTVSSAKALNRRSRRSGRYRHGAQNWSRRDEAFHRKVNSKSYKAGRCAGNEVGLDSQLGGTSHKLIN